MISDRSAPARACLRATGLRVARGGRALLDAVELDLPSGEVVAVCGANGSGKSTLLAALAGLVPLAAGSVTVDGAPVHRMRRRDIARRIAVLTQGAPAAEGFSVRELVHLGRHPWRGPLQPPGRADRDAVDWALTVTGMTALTDRDAGTLSGGERQRAHLAMALAQGGRYLLLDEPTTYLDPRHQLDILDLVRDLNRTHGLTVLWVLHDLNQAAHYSDRVVVLANGGVQAEGPPAQALAPGHVAAAFNLRVLHLPHPETGEPLCVPSIHQDMPGRTDAS